VKLAEEVQQVDQGAAQAIDRPGRDHVDVAPGNGLQQPIEARALVAALGAGDTGVLEKLDEAPVMALRSALLRTCRPPRRSAPAANAFNPAIESDVLGMTVLLWDYGGTGLCRQLRRGSRRAMARSSDDGLGRAERDNHGRRSRRILATLRRMAVRVSNRKSVRHRQRRKLVGSDAGQNGQDYSGCGTGMQFNN